MKQILRRVAVRLANHQKPAHDFGDFVGSRAVEIVLVGAYPVPIVKIKSARACPKADGAIEAAIVSQSQSLGLSRRHPILAARRLLVRERCNRTRIKRGFGIRRER